MVEKRETMREAIARHEVALQHLQDNQAYAAAFAPTPRPPEPQRFEARRTWPFGYHVHYNGYTTVRAMTLKRLARKLEKYAAPRVLVTYCKSGKR